MLRRLLVGLPLIGFALAACSAPSSLRIDRVDYAIQYQQNGAAGDLTVYWSGNPSPPVTFHYDPGPGCSQGVFTCGPTTKTASAGTNPVVWRGLMNCTGNAPSVAPWRVNYNLYAVDGAGHRSQSVNVASTCFFGPTTLRYVSIVVHRQPWLTSVLRPVTDVSWKLVDVSRSLALALSLVLLIAFPSQLFNSTLQAHYEEVMGWLERFRPLGRAIGWLRQQTSAGEAGSPRWLLAGVFVLGGLLGSLLDPNWRFDLATLEAFLGILLASAFTTAVYTWVRAQYLHRALNLHGHFRVYGGGLVVALCCLLISRLTSAEPGYLYGVLMGYTLGAAAPALARHHQGRQVGLGASATLVVSVGVWLLWTPIKALADATDFVPLVILSTAMAGVFAGGMTSLLFGLLPLRWLDGEKLLAWQRFAWIGLVVAGMFLFVHVVLNNAASTPHAGRNLAVTIGLFIGFGALSTGFWAYFRFRPEPAAMAPAPA